MKIFFSRDATPDQIDAVERRLREDADVQSSLFVSKEQSFARMEEKYPELVANLSFNPLPDSIEVRLNELADVQAFVSRYRAMKLPGVDDPGLRVPHDTPIC